MSDDACLVIHCSPLIYFTYLEMIIHIFDVPRDHYCLPFSYKLTCCYPSSFLCHSMIDFFIFNDYFIHVFYNHIPRDDYLFRFSEVIFAATAEKTLNMALCTVIGRFSIMSFDDWLFHIQRLFCSFVLQLHTKNGVQTE